MLLASYKDLIRNIPFLEHSFATKQTTWRREYKKHSKFARYCDKVFVVNTLKLSREDLLEAANNDFYEGLFSIIFWGYPRNMRGNTFGKILDSLEEIYSLLSQPKELTIQGYNLLTKQLNGKGVGLSTLSKILYFFRFTIEGKQCLILDSRIIDVLNSKFFSELAALHEITSLNKAEKYFDYLSTMEEVSKSYSFKSDQLELFLFLFGNSLKPSVLVGND